MPPERDTALGIDFGTSPTSAAALGNGKANLVPNGGASARARGFISGPIYDSIWLIFAPLWALLLGIAVAHTPFLLQQRSGLGNNGDLLDFVLGVVIGAHLVLVFFRSHANATVLRRHPIRFTIVPVVLFLTMQSWLWFAVTISVLCTWWDVYHSSLQTFGLGRIYDAKLGNDRHAGRTLDWALNLLLYAGPILGGATLMAHVNDFHEYRAVGSVFFTAIPAQVESHRAWLTYFVLGVGAVVVLAYVLSYWGHYRAGYRVSWQKVALVAGTGICSIYTWGFNSFGVAFFIMNVFHSVQYFALVWWAEGKNLSALFRLTTFSWGRIATFSAMTGLCVAYGVWREFVGESHDWMHNLVLVVAVMHFWYDGFIWSVRQSHV